MWLPRLVYPVNRYSPLAWDPYTWFSCQYEHEVTKDWSVLHSGCLRFAKYSMSIMPWYTFVISSCSGSVKYSFMWVLFQCDRNSDFLPWSRRPINQWGRMQPIWKDLVDKIFYPSCHISCHNHIDFSHLCLWNSTKGPSYSQMLSDSDMGYEEMALKDAKISMVFF